MLLCVCIENQTNTIFELKNQIEKMQQDSISNHVDDEPLNGLLKSEYYNLIRNMNRSDMILR